MDNNQLQIRCLKGKAILPYLMDLAKLRIEIFREYPYLYEGDLDYEKNYLQTYASCPHSFLALVFDEKQVVGASTAIPLQFEEEEFKKPFLDKGIDIKKVFYFGESVLLPEYRGKHIYRAFFRKRETEAQNYGSKEACFCAVERPGNHPSRPKHYVSLDKIWQHFGYIKANELSTEYSWKDLGDRKMTAKTMIFWRKKLNSK